MRAAFLLALLPAAAVGRTASDPRYLADFDFIVETVRDRGAAVKVRKLDWDAIAARFRPRFETCADDVEHVKNIMALLATLRDAHTGVTDTTVDRKRLPAKFDGQFGGGLWFGFDEGKWILRGVMPGHPSASQIPPGSMLTAVEGLPAWFVLERMRRTKAEHQGQSSDHSFFASLGNALFPFGEKQEISLTFALPDGKAKTIAVPRWGPGGRSFGYGDLGGPAGLRRADGATGAFWPQPWSKSAAYLKITGGMNAPTVRAFHAAFDSLKGLDALFLDGRVMDGGGDDSAWEMNGRLHPKGADNGRHGRIAPSGAWQFAGPVVVAQSENDVSSAETFLWAISETGRAITIGRPTGGWGIIPDGFKCPSGLVSFRLGVNARPTPIKGVQTEGVGWPPDLLLPFGPAVSALDDPESTLGLDVLRVLHAGQPIDEVRAGFRALFEGDLPAFRAFAKKAAAKAKGFDGEKLAKLFQDDLRGEIAVETAALKLADDVPPEVLRATKRLARLQARAKNGGLAASAAELEKALKSLKSEALAQEALLALPSPDFSADSAAQKAFLSKHAATRTARFLRAHVWR